jgi:hypothetical protein
MRDVWHKLGGTGKARDKLGKNYKFGVIRAKCEKFGTMGRNIDKFGISF